MNFVLLPFKEVDTHTLHVNQHTLCCVIHLELLTKRSIESKVYLSMAMKKPRRERVRQTVSMLETSCVDDGNSVLLQELVPLVF